MKKHKQNNTNRCGNAMVPHVTAAVDFAPSHSLYPSQKPRQGLHCVSPPPHRRHGEHGCTLPRSSHFVWSRQLGGPTPHFQQTFVNMSESLCCALSVVSLWTGSKRPCNVLLSSADVRAGLQPHVVKPHVQPFVGKRGRQALAWHPLQPERFRGVMQKHVCDEFATELVDEVHPRGRRCQPRNRVQQHGGERLAEDHVRGDDDVCEVRTQPSKEREGVC